MAIAQLPHLRRGERQERQRRRQLGDRGDHLFGQLGVLVLVSGAPCRIDEDALQIARRRRRQELQAVHEALAQHVELLAAQQEVVAHRHHDADRIGGIVRGADECTDVALALGRVVAQREQLLELIDVEQERAVLANGPRAQRRRQLGVEREVGDAELGAQRREQDRDR